MAHDHFLSFEFTNDSSNSKDEWVTVTSECGRHYENTLMQYTAIFHGCKNDNLKLIVFTIFIFLLKTYIVGTRKNRLIEAV